MADRNDFDRERDWDRDHDREREHNTSRDRWDARDRNRWSGAQDWDRERHDARWFGEPVGPRREGGEDLRRNQPWAGEQRQGDFREPGDWGRSGNWGLYGNRPDNSRENDWTRRHSGGSQTSGGISQWGGGSGQYGAGTGQWGGGMSSYSGGMGSYMDRENRGERGRFTGRGPKNYTRSDDRIREDINERLTDHPEIDASEIEVQVKDGEVTLTGTVDDRHTKRLAEDVADSVSGVKQVHNQIRLEAHSPAGR
jgi:hypothetical protein